jgi:predicted nucleotidyltransferase
MVVTAADTAEHLRKQAGERQRAAAARASRLLASVPAAAQLLREHYGAGEVVLFGSLATGAATDRSDVDVAARGLATADYFAALADLMALFGGPVDLVRLEEAPPSLAARIAAEGRPL